mmetsp:Transcript_113487/g.316048  ORF Transcript_113487/g.316048 Transcript_113487/m.316048 type:complete len:225 (-) Transcript_113487:969-1643(-)
MLKSEPLATPIHCWVFLLREGSGPCLAPLGPLPGLTGFHLTPLPPPLLMLPLLSLWQPMAISPSSICEFWTSGCASLRSMSDVCGVDDADVPPSSAAVLASESKGCVPTLAGPTALAAMLFSVSLDARSGSKPSVFCPDSCVYLTLNLSGLVTLRLSIPMARILPTTSNNSSISALISSEIPSLTPATRAASSSHPESSSNARCNLASQLCSSYFLRSKLRHTI